MSAFEGVSDPFCVSFSRMEGGGWTVVLYLSEYSSVSFPVVSVLFCVMNECVRVYFFTQRDGRK